MAYKLHENLTSSYFEAANKLNSKKSRTRVVAYVESYDDVFFWRQILTRFEDDKIYFEVMLPSKMQRLQRGKKAALMHLLSNHVGQHMIACVDADYDYLIQGKTHTSFEIIHNPYIFHTYAYSIENMQCYAPSLHDVCVAVTLNDHIVFDIRRYIEDFSRIIFPLFVWSVWHYKWNEYNDFSITDFLSIIETGKFSFAQADDKLRRLSNKIEQKIATLEQLHPNATSSYNALRQELLSLGVTPETTYLYIQGHHLFDKVILPMMNKICQKLVKQRENEIARQSIHGTQRHNEMACYTKSIEDIIPMLKKNYGFMLSEEYKRIVNDISQYVQKIKTPTST